MKLIVGLGNKGEKYKNNRHNVGFMFLDYLVDSRKSSIDSQENEFKFNKYVNSDTSIISFTNNQRNTTNDLILAKPTTYMNKSGEAVKLLIKQYGSADHRLTTNNLIIVHDDLDIPFGKFRIVKGYGPKLHNGLESIQNHLHTMDFLRIRIGVDNRPSENRIPGIDYVLQDFNEEERKRLPKVFDEIIERMKIEKICNITDPNPPSPIPSG